MAGKFMFILAPAMLALGLSGAVEAGHGKGYYGTPAKHGYKFVPPGHRVAPPHRHHRYTPRRGHYAVPRHGFRHGHRKQFVPGRHAPPVRYYYYPAPRYYPAPTHGVIYYSAPRVGVSVRIGH